MRTDDLAFSPELITKIVRCVEDAVGDDILADIRHHDLRTTNSVPSRIWDFLNSHQNTGNRGLHNCGSA